MGKRSSYAPGTFSWVDLATTDTDDAKRFYAELFGWSYDDRDAGGGGTYTEASIDGDAVAGLYSQPEQQRSQGAPPFWSNYVTVASADDAASRASELGGSVHAAPFDVLDAGRMAVIADPTGAMLGVWEPGESIGARRVNDPGCMTWNELSTNDAASAIDFYSSLFGWRIEPIDTGGGPPYWSISHDGGAEGRNGGMRELAPEQEGVPPHWMPYFTVASVDETIDRAEGAGGRSLAGPLDLPTGRIVILSDPQGAVFAIFEGDVDD
jgi:predicted enzyme related to lactoylglutathione lyase